MLAHVGIGDVVSRRHPSAQDGSEDKSALDVTGDVIEVAQHAVENPPVYTVR